MVSVKEATDALNALASLASIAYDDLYGDMDDGGRPNTVTLCSEALRKFIAQQNESKQT